MAIDTERMISNRAVEIDRPWACEEQRSQRTGDAIQVGQPVGDARPSGDVEEMPR